MVVAGFEAGCRFPTGFKAGLVVGCGFTTVKKTNVIGIATRIHKREKRKIDGKKKCELGLPPTAILENIHPILCFYYLYCYTIPFFSSQK